MIEKTTLGVTVWDKIIIILVPSVLGGVIGWFLPIIAGWIGQLPFIPFGQFIEWISTLNTPWIAWIGLAIGVVAGITFTLYAFSEILKIVLDDENIQLTVKHEEITLKKKRIEAIFLDNKQLVLLGDHGRELFRGKPEVKKTIIKECFEKYDYPWKEEDPYKHEYLRWVEHHPDLSAHINALLVARESALEKNDEDKAKGLRHDLAELGIVIRDEDKKQYVRIAGE